MFKIYIALILFFFSHSVMADQLDRQCGFFSNYAEILFKEKTIKKTTVTEAVDSVLFVVRSSNDYQMLGNYEQQAFDSVVRDLGNQVYAYDTDDLKDVKEKAVDYCKHAASEVNRTQAVRIAYCQKKGQNAEIISEAIATGVDKDDLKESVFLGLGKIRESDEFKYLDSKIDELYKMKEHSPSFVPSDIGEFVYKQCLVERG